MGVKDNEQGKNTYRTRNRNSKGRGRSVECRTGREGSVWDKEYKESVGRKRRGECRTIWEGKVFIGQ